MARTARVVVVPGSCYVGRTRPEGATKEKGNMKFTFEWDEVKAKANFKKHLVSFEEGKTIFNDPFLFTFPDNEHSINEERYINIGISVKGRVLVLIHTERKGKIRIISCRKATASERRFYEEGSL